MFYNFFQKPQINPYTFLNQRHHQNTLFSRLYSLHFTALFFEISGPPGAGKSTTAQIFGRNHGYVYYEADCFVQKVSPFIDLNVADPSLSQLDQTPLKVRF